ncbi:restriction endonuclease subunit S [Psittacicella gerlachiana]|uniref:Type I restriction modification DNA specificity domain-containing protein n=1 Tax=Psittacicella gerlachiana TaxID=2028574 RepID=A0A3A1Y1D9_9GAMM|nr:hypothetical protein [Psittacicella gerlachiana]RIY31271.1 hypothetical protein CKF59_07760 [Psittacicella gerlachiana]
MNFATPNGRYKFFSCGEEDLKCDEYAYDTNAVIIPVNGNIKVKHYSGKFNVYHCVYVLGVNDSIRYLKAAIYCAANDMLDYFKMIQSGSVMKFMKKTELDKLYILRFKNDHILYSKLNTLLDQIELNNKEIDSLSKLKQDIMQLIFSRSIKLN